MSRTTKHPTRKCPECWPTEVCDHCLDRLTHKHKKKIAAAKEQEIFTLKKNKTKMKYNKFAEGVAIIERHIPDDKKDRFGVNAEHDQIWFGEFEWVPEGVDKSRLLELGWFEDEDSWSCWA